MSTVFSRTDWSMDVHLIGIGGIGSWLAYYLMKHGIPTLHVYDDDTVEERNAFFQLYRREDAGELKVDALADFARREGLDTEIVPHAERVTEKSELDLSDVVISGVDSMNARHHIWEQVRLNGRVQLYMDGRIGGDNFHLYTLNPSDPSQLKYYEAWLYKSDQADQDPCSTRDDFHAALTLGGFMMKNLISFARDEQPAQVFQGDMSVVAVPGGAIPVVQIP